MTDAILAEAADRAARNEAFVLATVVWRRAPSSGQVGSRALVFGDGAMRGWLGGACAQPTVRREALTALQDGRSRLILLGIPPEAADAFGESAVVKPMACGSEGALAVYVEPFVPVPLVVAVGRSPAVTTLIALADDLGWRSAAVAEADGLASVAIDGTSAVVVATQGEADEEALEAALRTSAGYVGLVASRKRADATLGYLRARGVPEADLARVQAPAGLDLGSIDHREIAVAVLAELVARRARGELRAVGPASASVAEAVDPVCGMAVDVESARWHMEFDGRTWYFCGPGCLQAFSADPGSFVSVPASASSGTGEESHRHEA